MQVLCDTLVSSLREYEGKTVAYFDRPVYMNVGDLLIYEGSRVLLDSLNIKTLGTFSLADLGKVTKDRRSFAISPRRQGFDEIADNADLIVSQGGGNFGDLWIDHQLAREALLTRFPHKRIVILPQTVEFRSSENFERMRRVFASHGNVHFFARDAESYEIMKEVCGCSMAPDTAHLLWLNNNAVKNSGRSVGLLRQKRRDAEAQELNYNSDGFDWDNMITLRDQTVKRLSEAARRANIARSFFARLWEARAREITHRAAKAFSEVAEVKTDRLHGMILSNIVETRCLFADNSYGKLSRYYNAWLSQSPFVSVEKR